MSKAGTAKLAKDLRHTIPKIVGNTPVRLAYLYGSVAQGYATPWSDVDIALVIDPDEFARLDAYARLLLETDMALALEQQCRLPEADIHIINNAPVMVQGTVVREGVLLYASDPNFRVDYEVNALRRYLDYHPIADMHRAAYFAHSSGQTANRKEETMIDRRRIEDIFRNLDLYVSQLYTLATMPEEDLVTDLLKQGAARYYFQVAVEACLDVAHHVIARQQWRKPETYADAFAVLAEQGVVDKDFLPTLARMARFRNRLVHLYWEVDPNTIYQILQENLADFDRFKTLVITYLARIEGDE
ncbi:MAG: DUF86 domain-containing protein [Chloroflexi bacterium]|nr:DUF86 domain-containing protein [Chloroflexota bacterium]